MQFDPLCLATIAKVKQQVKASNVEAEASAAYAHCGALLALNSDFWRAVLCGCCMQSKGR